METWANVKGYQDYQVSNLGRVRSFKNGKQVIIKGWIQNTGYLTVCFEEKKYSVHRIVAETFIHKEIGKEFVNHIDGNKLNNKVENLEWCTQKENNQHAFKTGLMKNAIEKAKGNKNRSIKIKQFDTKGNFIREFDDSVEAQKYLNSNGINVKSGNIRRVCKGERNKAGGYIWRYS